MEIVGFTPKLRPSIYVRGLQEYILSPVADFQLRLDSSGGLDSSETDIARLLRHVTNVKRLGGEFSILGDIIDTDSPSNRKALNELRAGAYDSTELSLLMKDNPLIDAVCKEVLRPMRGRVRSINPGHHYSVTARTEPGGDTKVVTSTQAFVDYLGSPCVHGGDLTGLVVHMENDGQCLDGKAILMHGAGGGGTLGAPLARLIRQAEAWRSAGFIVSAHNMKNVEGKLPSIDFGMDDNGNPWLRGAHTRVVNIGGFHRGTILFRRNLMNEPDGGYVERAALPPNVLGTVTLAMRPVWDEKAPRVDYGMYD